MNIDNIINVKFLALLHDPAWKPWIITRKTGRIVKDILEKELPEKKILYEERKRAHESEAYAMAKIIGGLHDLSEEDRVVRMADMFSSSIDRFLVPYEDDNEEAQGGGARVNDVPSHKLNILNPNLRYDIKKPVGIDEFVKEAINLYPAISDKKLRYNVLYTSLELLWYKYNPESFPVADTRVYTHSVFDHLYATATMSNWFLQGNKPTGYFVKIDIPGIQQIISKARKSTDLWAGSWMLSFLAYKIIEPFIMEYGADVVISPFIGFNPFLISTLLNKLSIEVSNGKLDKKIMDEYKSLFPEDLHSPYQPVMPATLFLALPKVYDNPEEVKKKIVNNYREAWKKLIMELSRDKAILNDIMDYPIMPLRATVLDVGEEYDGFEKKVTAISNSRSSSEGISSVKLMDSAKSLFLEYLFKRASSDDPIKIYYGASLAFEANHLTSSYYSQGRNYPICTSCGTLPAIVAGEQKAVNQAANNEDVKSMQNKMINDDYLDEGERLCHYCYAKRVLGKGQKMIILDNLGFYINVQNSFEVMPSTIDIANIELWKEIFEEVKKCNGDNASRFAKPLPKPLMKYKDVGEVFYKPEDERLLDKILNQNKAKDALNTLGKYINCNYGFLNSLPNRVKTYYAIVKGDGDFIGKKIWRGGIKTDIYNYVMNTRFIESKYRDQIEKRLDALVDLMANLCLGPEEAVNYAAKQARKIDPKKYHAIPVTPVYIIAVSRALAVTAIKDSNTISDKGILIYAGGDDIMFLSSVGDSMELVKQTRLNYWGEPLGFHVLNGAIFDALALYGRSYGVLLAHHKDAMYNLWNIVTDLEELKDEVEVEIDSCGKEKQKDITVVLRGRGAMDLEDAAVIYNYPKEGSGSLMTFELLNELDESIGGKDKKTRKLSASFIKDWLTMDKDIMDAFSEEAIAFLINRNKVAMGAGTAKLLESLTSLNVKLYVHGGQRDQRTELIKAIDHIEV